MDLVKNFDFDVRNKVWIWETFIEVYNPIFLSHLSQEIISGDSKEVSLEGLCPDGAKVDSGPDERSRGYIIRPMTVSRQPVCKTEHILGIGFIQLVEGEHKGPL